jgi:hypothetical protein
VSFVKRLKNEQQEKLNELVRKAGERLRQLGLEVDRPFTVGEKTFIVRRIMPDGTFLVDTEDGIKQMGRQGFNQLVKEALLPERSDDAPKPD